jgi:hypothetical protein
VISALRAHTADAGTGLVVSHPLALMRIGGGR